MVYVTELGLVMSCRRGSNILVCDVIERQVIQEAPTQNVDLANYANYLRPNTLEPIEDNKNIGNE